MSVNRRRVLLRGRLLVLLVFALLACVTSAARAGVAADFYGVNAGQDVLDDAAGRPAALQTMRLVGLAYVRIDASWDRVEPAAPIAGQHRYDWKVSDEYVADLARQGLRWYPMIGYSTPWAASEDRDPFSPPANDTHYADFAAAIAGRYGPSGSFWARHRELPRTPTHVYGIWNEPNNPDFWRGGQATPARYLRLYTLHARRSMPSTPRPASRPAACSTPAGSTRRRSCKR